MLEGIKGIYDRIKTISSFANNLNSFKPEAVKEFEDMYKNVLNAGNEKKSVKNDDDVNPFLKTEKVEKTEKDGLFTDKKNSGMTIDEAVRMASKRYNVSEDLIRAVIKVESNFDRYGISRTGAMGLMQLMPQTVLNLGVEKPFDVYQNVDGGVRYLKTLMNRYNGDLDKSLAAYNAGTDAVDRAGGIPDIEETQNYVASIKKILSR